MSEAYLRSHGARGYPSARGESRPEGFSGSRSILGFESSDPPILSGPGPVRVPHTGGTGRLKFLCPGIGPGLACQWPLRPNLAASETSGVCASIAERGFFPTFGLPGPQAASGPQVRTRVWLHLRNRPHWQPQAGVYWAVRLDPDSENVQEETRAPPPLPRIMMSPRGHMRDSSGRSAHGVS